LFILSVFFEGLRCKLIIISGLSNAYFNDFMSITNRYLTSPTKVRS
jgi:hypothetical protein